ncbi:hypothetical protein [Methylohalobius crimeensis]|uniref:hypothetical protein n=1 Tax=Methylohalobius crimeensis TaxID=244365 RepID=UPI0003B5A0CA|nr:hypothetical protein [Methylohalobius crimeensis]
MKTIWPGRPIARWLTGVVALFAATAQAHTGGTVLDPGGANPHATDMADISCSSSDNLPPTAKLFARVKDQSPPEAGLLVNMQIIKGRQAISVTDEFSGDGEFSAPVELFGGSGTYTMLVDKTGLGPRSFEVEWHCMSENNIHTGTDITIRQIDTPQ